jgi:two-component system, cell cycle sensor histidine kinase and response regulator CckA
VAIASGYISEELRREAPAAGVDEIIYKPDTVEALCQAIEKMMAGRRL